VYSANNPNKILRHLETYHPNLGRELQEAQQSLRISEKIQQKTSEYLTRKSLLPDPSLTSIDEFIRTHKLEAVQASQALLVLSSGHSFRTLDSQWWPEIFEAGGLDSGASLSRTLFKRRYFPAIHRVIVERLKKIFDSHSHPSVTADCWTDKKLRSYLAVTIHWVDASSFKNMHALLDLYPLEERHHAGYLKESIQKAVDAIADDSVTIHCATGDGASNSSLSLRNYVGGENYIWCCAHRLNLVVQHSLELISNRIEEIRSLCRTLRNSPNMRKKLVSIANMEPFLDCATRWNSTHDMLQRFSKLLPTLTSLMQSDGDFGELVIPAWVCSSLRSIITILKPFKEVSKLSQSCSFPTLSFVPLWMRYLNQELESFSQQMQDSGSIPALLCHELREQLKHYFMHPTNEGNNVFKPQSIYIKSLFFSCRITWMSETELAITRGLLVPIFKQTPVDPVLQALKDLLSQDSLISSLFVSLQTALPLSYPYTSDVGRLNGVTCTSPAEWWQFIGSQSFAILTPMARMLLAIPATSAPSESTFSRAGFDDRENRSRLGAQTLRMSLLVSRNTHLFNRKELISAVTKEARQMISRSRKRTARPAPDDAAAPDSSSSDEEPDPPIELGSDEESSQDDV